MNPELQPEKRSDKNGNIVTRWVRSFKKKDAVAVIPAPELQAPESKRSYFDAYNRDLEESKFGHDDIDGPDIDYKEVSRLRQEIEAEIARVKPLLLSGFEKRRNVNSYDRYSFEDNLSLLIRYSPETLEKVIASSSSGDKERDFWGQVLTERKLYPSAARESEEVVEHFLNHYKVSLGTISGVQRMESGNFSFLNQNPYLSIWTARSLVNSILETSSDDRKTYSEETAEATLLFAYIRRLQDASVFEVSDMPEAQYDTNKEDIEFMAQNLDAIYDVLPELMQRKVTDRELVQTVIESPAAALMEGEL